MPEAHASASVASRVSSNEPELTFSFTVKDWLLVTTGVISLTAETVMATFTTLENSLPSETFIPSE